MPSITPSVVRISSAPRSGRATAASSPMPTTSQGGGAGTRARISAIRSRSPVMAVAAALPGKFRGPGFTNDGHLDLAGVFELVFNPSGDVLRQPDRLLVRDLLALDDDADFAAGLEGEGLGDAGERVGDAFQLLEALDVGLEDVAARAGA